MIKKTLTILLIAISTVVVAQEANRFEEIRKGLEGLSKSQPGLNQQVEFSASGASIQEFVRGVASVHNLNISIDPNLKFTVVNSFANATVSDVLLFVVKQYNLDIEFIGSIISVVPYQAPAVQQAEYRPKQLKITYNNTTDFLSFDLKRDSLDQVLKAITNQSLKNVIASQGLENELVSVFIKNRPFENALEKLAFANGLEVEKTEDDFYLITKAKAASVDQNTGTQRNNSRNARNNRTNNLNANQSSQPSEGLSVSINDQSLLTVSAVNVPLNEIVQVVSNDVLANYFLFSEPQGNTTLFVENVSYDEFLTYVLNGTDYTYRKDEGVYLIGERSLERLRTTEMVQMQNRTVESVIDFIPAELKADVDIQEFIELNSLILSGSHPKIEELKKFISQVDKVVPVVLIDVMIVDVDRTNLMKTGMKVSFGSGESNTTAGTVGSSSGAGFELNSTTLNDLIDQFNGFGIINLGKVAPDFQASFSALETAGVLKKRSTPKLATINGHEANMTIGETEYYLETQNNVVGTGTSSQNLLTQSAQYRSVNADLSVGIRPMVSGDDQVTLEIDVQESSFTARISETAPPGQKTTSFSSTIRVRNGEMILMGGLEKKTKNNTTEGLPFVAKIPVLRFFFSQRLNSNSKSKLHIFIKPTIIY